MRIRHALMLAPLVLGGIVVAVVNGQDSSRRSVLVNRQPARVASGQPTLATPPSSPTVLSDEASSRRQPLPRLSTSPSSRSTGGDAETPALLSDRLRSIRQSVTGGNATGSGSSTNVGPLNSSPSITSPSARLATPSADGEARYRHAIPGFVQSPEPAAESVTAPTPATPEPVPAAEIATKPTESRLDGQPVPTQAPLADSSLSVGLAPTKLIVSKGPVLRVEAAGPESVMIGKAATYSFTLNNDGVETANNVIVRVSLPAAVGMDSVLATVGSVNRDALTANGVRQLIWKVDSLAGHGRQELKLNLIPKTTQPLQMAVDWTFAPLAMTTRIAVREPKLEMRVSGPSDLLFGESKVYTVTVSNPGDGTTDNVKLMLEVGGKKAETMQIGKLAPGQVRDIEISMEANQAGPMNIQLVALADGGLRSQARQDVTVRRADLKVAVLGPRRKYAGSVSSYKVIVSNEGDATAKDVVAAAILPRGAKSISNEPLTWKIASLPSGGEREFIVRCELGDPGANQFEARTQASGGLADSTMLVTQVEAVADLKLEVRDPKGPLPVGQEVVYDVVISNRGSKAADGIELLAQFSNGIEPVAVEGLKGEIVPGQVVFDSVGRIDAGEKITVRIKAKADQDGNHIFRATVKCGTPETRLVSEETTHFFADDFGNGNATDLSSRPLSEPVR